jgi:hypothetical protein
MSTDLLRFDAFEVVRRLADGGAVTPVSLSLASRPDLTFQQFLAIGVFLDRLHDGTKWYIADWLIEGEARFGEKVYQAASALGRSDRTLQNWCWVASRIPASQRRETLPWTQRALVAPLGLEEQRHWLDRAEAEGWSSRELQAALADRRAQTVADEDACPDLDAVIDEVRDRLRNCYGEVRVEISVPGISYVVEAAKP